MKIKTIIFSLLAFFLTDAAIKAQPYSHYLDYTVRWHWKGGSGDGISYQHTWLNYYINGDTIINSKSYFKVNFLKKDSIVKIMFPGPPYVTVIGGTYSYAIREDSTKKFYAFYQGDTQETLIADFSLNVGDTFPNTSPACLIGTVDSLFSRKRWKPQTLMFGQGVLEGVGETGPLCSALIEGNMLLTCFSKNGTTLLIDSINDCYTIEKPVVVVHTSVKENIQENIVIYPNPAIDYLYLNNFSGFNQTDVEIFDCLGETVLKSSPTSMPFKLDISQLKSGLYIIEIHSGDKVEQRKFLKRDL